MIKLKFESTGFYIENGTLEYFGEGDIHVIKQFDFEIILCDECEEIETIGYMKGYLIKEYIDLEECFNTFDSISQSVLEFWELLRTTTSSDIRKRDVGNMMFEEAIYFVDSLHIVKEHRGKGYGSSILKNIVSFLGGQFNLNVGFVMLFALPPEDLDNKESIKKLQDDFYREIGYKTADSPIVKNLMYRWPYEETLAYKNGKIDIEGNILNGSSKNDRKH